MKNGVTHQSPVSHDDLPKKLFFIFGAIAFGLMIVVLAGYLFMTFVQKGAEISTRVVENVQTTRGSIIESDRNEITEKIRKEYPPFGNVTIYIWNSASLEDYEKFLRARIEASDIKPENKDRAYNEQLARVKRNALKIESQVCKEFDGEKIARIVSFHNDAGSLHLVAVKSQNIWILYSMKEVDQKIENPDFLDF